MITKDELSGIIDALGALSEDEVCAVAQEISFIRKEDFLPDILTRMCRQALDEHLLELIVSAEIRPAAEGAVSVASNEGEGYYIPGPNAFPDVPFELSEAIDILMITKKEVDWEKVSSRFSANLKVEVMELDRAIASLSDRGTDEGDLYFLAERYSNLLNLYYDYDSWLPEGISDMENELQDLSRRLEELKAAQGI
ncbi:MAG: hypothetical protein PWR29_234 [Methanolobus sp.]|jgi:hypothetical protein|nr:hypothetical protein [Methanolobus sp.]MDK2834944.1 hypothetical protein [Methanolobus sp.]MDK2911277.1 hypothetical protein [Methanolobus sp.]MDN5310787.1 hypothetical protein [Methanolobus sp.]